MPIRRRLLACALTLACGSESAGSSDGTADGSGTSGTDTTTATNPSTTAPSTSNTGTTQSTGPSGSDDPTGDPSGDPTGPDGSSTMATTDPVTGSSGAESSTGVGEPEEHHVQHGRQSACDDPLWCPYMGDIYTPSGGPIEGQECFMAPVDPPYELLSMHYSVSSTHTDLEDFELRVYAWEGAEPTELLSSESLNSLGATPMEHDYAFAAPIVVDTAGFCVGFATTAPGLASALGMAVDSDSVIVGTSWIRMEGPCATDMWIDAVDAGLDPLGNWCMDATIRTIP